MNLAVVALCFTMFSWPCLVGGSEGGTGSADTVEVAAVRPLERAHAHNDYHQDRPLRDALANGFCSVEADVFLVDGALLVGHSRSELSADRTLEFLYLDPLLKRVLQNDGWVYPGGPAFTLLVDVKSDGEATYLVLDAILAGYETMLTSVIDGMVSNKAVTVVVSGDRAWEAIESDPTRYVGIDGRLTDLSSGLPDHLMPLISDHWGEFFTWSGDGPIPDAERTKLRQLVRDVHAARRRIRFWATPDHRSQERTAVWTELLESGVDLVGTDDLAGLRWFLLAADDSCR